MIQAIIFDLDNTLYEYESCHHNAIQSLTNKASEILEISNNDFIQAFEYGKKEVKSRLTPYAACHNRLLYIENTLEYLNIPPALYTLDLYNAYWNTFLNNMKLFPWVLDLLDKLSQTKIKLVLCSDLTAHIQYRKLEKLKIEKYFNYIVTSEEAIFDKPDPAMFTLCLKKLRLNAEKCLFIGDSLEKDIQGAQNINMQVLQIKNGILNKTKFEKILKL